MLPGDVDALCERGEYSRKGGVIAGLIARRSVSVLVGDSGIGKSPLAYQLGLCVAAGVPFVGMNTEQGAVVYADLENSLDQSRELRQQLVSFLKLPKAPENFILWTPDSDDSPNIEGIFRDVRPTLFIIDSLRSFNPHFEKSENAGEEMKRLNSFARRYAVAILVIHHTRKPGENGVPALDSDETGLMLWLKQTAGHSSIINQSHSRLAVDLPDNRKSHSQDAALILRWHRRIQGEAGPIYLERCCDEDGGPLGYKFLAKIELLGNSAQEAALRKLPEWFTFKEAKHAYERSDDPTRKWLLKCVSLGLVRQIGKGRYECASPSPVALPVRLDERREAPPPENR